MSTRSKVRREIGAMFARVRLHDLLPVAGIAGFALLLLGIDVGGSVFDKQGASQTGTAVDSGSEDGRRDPATGERVRRGYGVSFKNPDALSPSLSARAPTFVAKEPEFLIAFETDSTRLAVGADQLIANAAEMLGLLDLEGAEIVAYAPETLSGYRQGLAKARLERVSALLKPRIAGRDVETQVQPESARPSYISGHEVALRLRLGPAH